MATLPCGRRGRRGWGCGETHHGMYALKARVKGEWLVARPAAISGRDAMAIVTAG